MRKKNKIEKIISSIRNIPPYPDIIFKARRMIKKNHSSIGDLSEIISKDPGLAGRILKLANSAFYNIKGKVGSIKYAAQILGLKTLCEIIETAAMEPMLKKVLNAYNMHPKELWHHSLFVAYCAKLICEKSMPDYAMDAFTAGLLHDTGKIILDPWLEKHIDKIKNNKDISILSKESMLLGINHAQIGYAVTKLWNLPVHIQLAIRSHHNTDFTKKEKFEAIISAANTMASASLSDNSQGEHLLPFNEISEKTGVNMEILVNLIVEAAEFAEKATG